MAPRHTTAARDDPSRPPLFSGREWGQIVEALQLSPRQAEVVGFIVQGESDKDIARLMEIGRSTVRSHFEDIQAKLAVTNRMLVSYRVFETFRRVVEERTPHK